MQKHTQLKEDSYSASEYVPPIPIDLPVPALRTKAARLLAIDSRYRWLQAELRQLEQEQNRLEDCANKAN